MILVKTELRQSPISGIGLYAGQRIYTGQVWWRFQPGFDPQYTREQVDALPHLVQKHVRHYGYLQNGLWTLCGDNGGFVNHSDQPNSIAIALEATALSDIEPGEEITEDYRVYCEDWVNMPFLTRGLYAGRDQSVARVLGAVG